MLQDAAAWLDERPYKEIYDGRIHPKVSPKRDHSLVQVAIGSMLLAWGCDRGDSGSEWRVYLDDHTSLVPDVSFISDERLEKLSEAELQKPPFAPELVVEIWSPDNRESLIRRKTTLYLEHGAIAVLDVDPSGRTVRVSTRDGETMLKTGDTFGHAAFPGLALSVDAIFAPLDRRRR
jgi:Uma2 family endonuclease